uniref:Tubby C-terminal domain-containing protein n=1 Tax=Erythrolobus madagascarensis TaxID=708628 RepID=A0A7S0XIC3_9RHOD|mmetsp:Transcript_3367/g.7267  ORF Transcript_3367/g.7267 Transcript_3367/m.7267 type:complete len:190 (+) Transcript_3367:62-631(+)
MQALSTQFAPLSAAHARSTPTDLIFQEKLTLTGDGAAVTDEDGTVLFRIKAKLMSVSARRELADASGAVIAGARMKKTPGLHAAVYIGPESNEKLMMVKAKGLRDITKCDVDIYLNDKVVGEACGNWRAKTFDVKINGQLAGQMTRKSTTAKGILFGADAYHVAVAPNVDLACMALLICALDEIYHDER